MSTTKSLVIAGSNDQFSLPLGGRIQFNGATVQSTDNAEVAVVIGGGNLTDHAVLTKASDSPTLVDLSLSPSTSTVLVPLPLDAFRTINWSSDQDEAPLTGLYHLEGSVHIEAITGTLGDLMLIAQSLGQTSPIETVTTSSVYGYYPSGTVTTGATLAVSGNAVIQSGRRVVLVLRSYNSTATVQVRLTAPDTQVAPLSRLTAVYLGPVL